MLITRSRAAGAVAAAIALAVGVPTAAEAGNYTATGSCSASGNNLNAQATDSDSGGYHVWKLASWTINGTPTGGKNNVNIRLYSGATQKWAWNSPDSMPFGNGHTGMQNAKTRPIDHESIFWTAIFDRSGVDPQCTAARKNF